MLDTLKRTLLGLSGARTRTHTHTHTRCCGCPLPCCGRERGGYRPMRECCARLAVKVHTAVQAHLEVDSVNKLMCVRVCVCVCVCVHVGGMVAATLILALGPTPEAYSRDEYMRASYQPGDARQMVRSHTHTHRHTHTEYCSCSFVSMASRAQQGTVLRVCCAT